MSEDPILKALADCNPNLPLEPGDHRFVDLDVVRGFALRKAILKRIQAEETTGRYAKIAVAGHRGGGKSTELNRALADLAAQKYVTLWASVNENLDPNDISFSDIMRLIVLLLDDRFGDRPGVKRAFDVVHQWFCEVTKTFAAEIQSAREFGLGLQVGGQASAELGGQAGGVLARAGVQFKTELGKLAAAINVVRRSEGKERIEIKDTLERYNSQLVENVNALLRAAAASEGEPTRIALILDNVDKYEPATVNAAFLRHAGLLQELEAHLIFTIQSSLLHRPVEDGVEQCYTTFLLPMLPVFVPHSRQHNPPVFEILRRAVYRRVPPELFAGSDEMVDDLIHSSGGCWRDLLRLLEAALLSAQERVEQDDVKSARQQVAQTFQRILRSDDDLKTLALVHSGHTLLAGEPSQYLLHHRCILAYNGEGWYDLHPLLDAYPPVKQAIEKNALLA